jgi:hypothetical protein
MLPHSGLRCPAMRVWIAAVPLLALVACSPGSSAGTPAPPSPTAGAANAAGLTLQACRVLTAGDVQAVLGVPVTQFPLTSPPPDAGPGGTLLSGCRYASSSATAGGASLYLYRDLAIGYFANVPGVQAVPGVGDAAYEHVPMLIGRKGNVTFLLTIDASADPTRADSALRALAHAAASRL